jgi:hypothetical protein
MRRWIIFALLLVFVSSTTQAQDGLDLPTELYILVNEGQVQRYGLGASGVSTVTPEGEFVLDFAVAPDNQTLAYRTQDGLFVSIPALSDMLPAETLLLDNNASYPDIRGQGNTIAWSPNMQALAYTTFGNGRVNFVNSGKTVDLGVADLQEMIWSSDGAYLAAGARGNIWWFYAVGIDNVQLVAALPDTTGIAWLSNGQVYFTPSTGGINLMDLQAGNAQTPIMDASASYFLPFVNEPFLQVLRGTPQAARYVRISADGENIVTEEIGQGDIDTANLRWSPNGAFLMAFNGGALALVEPTIGEGFNLPVGSASAYAWGGLYPERAVSAITSADLFFMAEVGSTGVTQVWRKPSNGEIPEPITPASEDITEYAMSPNAQQIAYVSDNTLWYYTLSAPLDEVYEIASNATEDRMYPSFSADGAFLFYDNQNADGAGIFRADLESGVSVLWLADTETSTYRQPLPSSDISAMIVLRDAEGGRALVDTNTAEDLQVSFNPVRWLKGGDATIETDPVSVVNVTSLPANIRPLPPINWLDIIETDDDLFRMVARPQRFSALVVVDTTIDAQASLVANIGYVFAPSLSPDGRFVAGLTNPSGGELLVVDIENNITSLISVNTPIHGLLWR